MKKNPKTIAGIIGLGVDILQEDNGFILSSKNVKCQFHTSASSLLAVSVEPTEVSVEYGIKHPSKAIRYRGRCKSITTTISIKVDTRIKERIATS